MGMIHANIELVNAVDLELSERHQIGEEEVRSVTIASLVDTGAVMLSINEEICAALGLRIKDHRPSQLADGRRVTLPVAGPVEVRFEGRFCTTNALVLPGDSEVLLGKIPQTAMDLAVDSNRQVLTFAHSEGWLVPLPSVR